MYAGTVKMMMDEGVKMPEKHGEWYDLAVAQDIEMKAGETKIISFGVRAKAPEGYYIWIVPRSSTIKKWGIQQGNSVGIIEREYCGNNDTLGFVGYAVRDTFIPAGTRIAQFTLMPVQPEFDIEVVEDMGEPDRGGYGSTGN